MQEMIKEAWSGGARVHASVDSRARVLESTASHAPQVSAKDVASIIGATRCTVPFFVQCEIVTVWLQAGQIRRLP